VVPNIAYPPSHARTRRWPSQRLDCTGEKPEVRWQASSKHGLHYDAPICSSKNITQQVTGNLGIHENSSARSLRTVVLSSVAVAVPRHTIVTGGGQQVRHMGHIRHVHPRLRRSVMTTPRLKNVFIF